MTHATETHWYSSLRWGRWEFKTIHTHFGPVTRWRLDGAEHETIPCGGCNGNGQPNGLYCGPKCVDGRVIVLREEGVGE